MSLLGKKHKRDASDSNSEPQGLNEESANVSHEPSSDPAAAPVSDAVSEEREFFEGTPSPDGPSPEVSPAASQEVREQETSADLVHPPVADEDLPVQTDRPSYGDLWAGGQADREVRVRQIRHRPSNLPMVAGIFITREWQTVNLASVADRGRSHMRELADDQTIEVHFED